MREGMLQSRRNFMRVAALGGTFILSGCKSLSEQDWVRGLLISAEQLTRRVQRLFAGSHALAVEYSKSDIAPVFRANGTTMPASTDYQAMAANGFAGWRIVVSGLVERPLSLSMAELKRMPSRTQITRHDCVEGWSCIGEWTGTPLKYVLALARPKDSACYVVFHCADPMDDLDGDGMPESSFYYESLDLVEATHPQTLLAYGLNGKPLPVENGAPVRLRAERQLGYKQPKYIQRIELVESFDHIGGGKGGYWEDQGYNWWGGI